MRETAHEIDSKETPARTYDEVCRQQCRWCREGVAKDDRKGEGLDKHIAGYTDYSTFNVPNKWHDCTAPSPERVVELLLPMRQQLAASQREVERLRGALEILSKRQCGSYCTEKDKNGKERYPDVKDRCAACIARAALAPAGNPAGNDHVPIDINDVDNPNYDPTDYFEPPTVRNEVI